jgi:hypothetical protein
MYGGEAKNYLHVASLKNLNNTLNLEDGGLTVDKSGVVAANDGPGWSTEAPGVVN